ncbi:hypothetical protein B0H11DRAFT_1162024 [Mycena galericulata]|nr:hypothetical protein B0H11DRAFT_1162024 [Mycena galericulata]
MKTESRRTRGRSPIPAVCRRHVESCASDYSGETRGAIEVIVDVMPTSTCMGPTQPQPRPRRNASVFRPPPKPSSSSSSSSSRPPPPARRNAKTTLSRLREIHSTARPSRPSPRSDPAQGHTVARKSLSSRVRQHAREELLRCPEVVATMWSGAEGRGGSYLVSRVCG